MKRSSSEVEDKITMPLWSLLFKQQEVSARILKEKKGINLKKIYKTSTPKITKIERNLLKSNLVENYTMTMDWKTQLNFVKVSVIPKQIYIPAGIFMKIIIWLKIYVEMQRSKNSQDNLEGSRINQ